MNQLPILVRREFWEHRNTFVLVPALTTAFLALMMVLLLVLSASVDIETDSESRFFSDESSNNAYDFAIHQLAALRPEERSRYLNTGLQSLSAPLVVILWFVMFFYLLNALYDDRRDRSILFWKSLPVSDAMTVLTKLLTGLILVPLCYLAGVALLQLLALLLLSIATIGTDISAWEAVWVPASILANWMQTLSVLLFYSLWALPFFGWLLAVSAYAKSIPLIWAGAVPFGLSIVEAVVTDQSMLAKWMSDHTIPIRYLSQQHSVSDSIGELLFSLDMVSALVVGSALILLAIWLRGKADEI